jgi:hypothetical protein
MKHLVFIIHNGHIEYRMDNRHGSHPLLNEQPKKVIDFLIKMIQPLSHEVITA